MEYKLFPGCLIQNRVPFLEASARFVFEKVGLQVSDSEFGCCPNPVGIKPTDTKSWLALGARNLCLAEKENKPIMSLCNGCYQTLFCVNHELQKDEIAKREINEILAKVGKEFKGTTDVLHFVNVLATEVGFDKIRKAIVKPLTGLKVACHAGCHYSRPSHILHNEDPFKPQFLRKLVECTGATVVDYEADWLCCGNVVRNANEGVANTMLKAKLDSAMNSGAECLAVNCPACFQTYDNDQGKLKDLAAEGQVYKFPIYYVTELLAMAMGKDPKDMGIPFHRNKGSEVLSKLGFEI